MLPTRGAAAGGARVDGLSLLNMERTMHTDESLKNGRLQLLRGGTYGRRVRVRTASEIELDERMRRMYTRCVDRNGKVPSRGVQEIREGRQAPWRVPARRAIEMARAGVPTEHIKAALVDEFAQWLDETLPDFQPKRAA